MRRAFSRRILWPRTLWWVRLNSAEVCFLLVLWDQTQPLNWRRILCWSWVPLQCRKCSYRRLGWRSSKAMDPFSLLLTEWPPCGRFEWFYDWCRFIWIFTCQWHLLFTTAHRNFLGCFCDLNTLQYVNTKGDNIFSAVLFLQFRDQFGSDLSERPCD